MTNKEIVEGNLLISKFMGIKFSDPRGYTIRADGSLNNIMVFPKECKFWKRYSTVMEDELSYVLEFHSSWDWLMEVIIKIQKSHMSYTISQPYDIESEFHAIVEFIKWYNKVEDDKRKS